MRLGKEQRTPPTPDKDKITTLHAMQHDSPPSYGMKRRGRGKGCVCVCKRESECVCVLWWDVKQTPFPHHFYCGCLADWIYSALALLSHKSPSCITTALWNTR